MQFTNVEDRNFLKV